MKGSRTVPVVFTIVIAAVIGFIIYVVYLFTNYNDIPSGMFYFSSGTAGEFSDQLPSLSIQELIGYIPEHSECISEYYKSQLDDDRLCIYNAALYAADNEYTCVYFPPSCFDDTHPIEDTLSLVSCDDPFFEHNFTSDGNFELSMINFDTGDRLYYFELSHNTPDYADKRERAYDRAKEIVDGIPADCDTEFEKAAYLYDYTSSNVLYDHSEDYSSDTVPIYDALVDDKHMTVCDGFADTVTLLYNLAGLPTFTIEGVNSDGVGHVVNVAKLSGEYYYLDSTSDSAAWELGVKGRFFYLMTEDMLGNYFVKDEAFNDYKLPQIGVYPAEQVADIIVAEINDELIDKAGRILNEQGCVLAAFSASFDKDMQSEFGRMISLKVGKSVTITKKNAIAAYTFKDKEAA